MRTIKDILVTFLFITILTATFLAIETNQSQAQLIYSHEFTQGVVYGAGTPQYDDWLSFRASLPTEGITSINLSGSQNPIGRSCNDPAAAQQIADALRNTGPGMQPHGMIFADVECGEFLWRVVACDGVPNNTLLEVLEEGDDLSACSCDISYALGPAISDGDWGGIDGLVCSAPSQEIRVLVGLVSTSVPTLSEWGLMAMAGILGIVGFMVIRRRNVLA